MVSVNRIVRHRLFPFMAAFVTASIIVTATGLFIVSEERREAQGERLQTLYQMSTVRARLEGTLNSRLLLANSIVSYIAVHGNIDHEIFQSLSTELIQRDQMIRNISLLKNTVIVDACPMKGNEKAIGVDLATIPGQSETLQRAIETKQPVVAGPVTLVQGGVGIISRVPIFLSPKGKPVGSGGYWGQTSVVIMQDALFEEAGILDPSSRLTYAIRGKDALGADGAIFWGDETVFRSSPVVMNVVLPGGTWQMAAIPKAGWGPQSPSSFWFAVVGGLLAMFAGWTIWSLLVTRKTLQEGLRTERSLMEKVTGSEAKYRNLFEEAPFMYVITRNNEGVPFVSDCNERFLRSLGYEREEMQDKPLADFYSLESRAALLEGGGYARALAGEFFIGERHLLTRDGRLIPALLYTARELNDSGEVIGTRGMFVDITDRKKAEEALLRAKGDWETIFQAIGHPTVIMDVEHRIVAANKAAIEVSGKSHDELLNTKCYDLFHKSNEPPQHCPMEALLKSGSTETVEMEMEALGGYFLVKCTPVLGETGKIERMIHVATDITSRKKSEESLRLSEERHRSLIEHLPQRIFLKDRNSVYVSCNTNYAADLGIVPEQIVGKDDFAFHPAELAQLYRADDRACMETGTVKDFEEPYQLAGQERWAHTIKVPYRDGEGQVIGVLGIFEDITDRKKSEDALRESEERYRELFSQSMDGIYVTAREGMLLDCNQAFLDILGYKRDDIVGGDIRTVYANPSDRDRFVRVIEESGSIRDYPLSFRRKDGREIEILLTSNVRRAANGSIIGYQGILRDVTEHKNLQKQLVQAQKMEAIGTLAGGVSHDFNNILQVVLGYSELILGYEDLPARHRADLRKMNEAARRGADLVQRLLTFSRKTEIKPRPLDLNRRINEMRKMIERTIPKMIDIQLVLAEDLAAISADATQVDQVLMNLAVNARDAMPDRGKLVIETANIVLDEDDAGTRIDAEPGNYVLLMVTDTGSGMDKETLEHIFEPFYTTKSVGEGTGLGLAMVHGIVRQHGGHIRCYSEPGEGTTFSIYFPALVSTEDLEQTKDRPMPRGGSETILLADDEELIRELGSRILTKAGYKVITASNGKEALDMYERRGGEIALVVLDLIMPEMGGKQCLEELLKVNPQVKALIASGFAVKGDTKTFLDTEAKGIVPKPFNTRELLWSVRHVLDGM